VKLPAAPRLRSFSSNPNGAPSNQTRGSESVARLRVIKNATADGLVDLAHLAELIRDNTETGR